MGIETLFNATCTIRRRDKQSGKDKRGAKTGTYTYTDLATGVNCRLEGRLFRDNDLRAEAVSVTHILYLPKKTDIRQTDLVTAVTMKKSGTVVLAEGKIQSANLSPGGLEKHVEADMLEVR